MTTKDQDLRTALEPFARAAAEWDPEQNAGDVFDDAENIAHGETSVTVGDLRRARAALTPAQAPDKAGEREGLNRKRLSNAIDGAIDKLRFCHQDATADELDVAADNYLNAALAPQTTGTEASRGVGAVGEVDAALIHMLQADNIRMRAAGLKLSEAALHVIREYDGTHRLSLAVAEWAKAVADEGGREDRFAATPTPPLSPDSTGPAVNEIKDAPEDEAVILFTEGEWVGEARMIRHEQTGDPIWIWATGLPVHPNHKPLGWQNMPSFAALTPSAPIAAPVRDDGARMEEIALIIRRAMQDEMLHGNSVPNRVAHRTSVADAAARKIASLSAPGSTGPGEDLVNHYRLAIARRDQHIGELRKSLTDAALLTTSPAQSGTGDAGDNGVTHLASLLLAEIDGLISESEGIAGLHLNGDVAPWDEVSPGGRFERLTSLEDLRTALSEQEPGTKDTGALADIAAERRRQIEAEGYTVEHDDTHEKGEIARAAATYAMAGAMQTTHLRDNFLGEWVYGKFSDVRSQWPGGWDWSWFKPTTPRRDLVKAGALIVAEIERLDRTTPAPAGDVPGEAQTQEGGR